MHRTRDRSKLASATWKPALGHAVVTKVRGKYFQNVGFSHHGQCLFCEEAVFLVDRDEMELVKEEDEGEGAAVYSRAEAFDLLNQCGISMAAYHAYSCLAEQRFRVYRHGAWRANKAGWQLLPAPSVGVNVPTAATTSLEEEEGESAPKRARSSSSSTEAEVTIAYDVYLPQASNFSKTQLPPPSFSLVLLRATDPLPPIPVLKRKLTECGGDTVLRLCIVGDSSMSFIEVSDFDPVAEHAAAGAGAGGTL